MSSAFVVFDLDGTLIDGYDAIGDALGYAMRRLGFPEPSAGEVRRMVGHGLEKLLEKAVGPEKASEGVSLFRERYPEVAVEKSRLMPDVPEVLAELGRLGHVMAVASNKPSAFSRLILEAKGVAHHFRSIGGPDERTPPKPDPAMLFRMMEEAGARPDSTVVVGDMEVDAELARAGGCRAVLIASGSRSREELSGVPADAILARLLEFPCWLEKTFAGTHRDRGLDRRVI